MDALALLALGCLGVTTDSQAPSLPDHAVAIFGDRRFLESTQVSDVAFSPDGKLLASGTPEGPIALWDAKTGAKIATLIGQDGRITRLRFSSDGKFLASLSGGFHSSGCGNFDNYEESVRVWDLAMRCDIAQFQLNRYEYPGYTAMAVASDGREVALGLSDGQIVRASTKTGTPINVWVAHEKSVTDLAYLKETNSLVSSGEDGACRVWNAENGEMRQELHKDSRITCLQVTEQQLVFLCFGSDRSQFGLENISPRTEHAKGFALAWNPDSGLEWETVLPSTAMSMSLSSDGQQLAIGSQDGNLFLLDPADGKLQAEVPFGYSAVHGVSFSPDTRQLAISNYSRWIYLFDLDKKGLVARNEGHLAAVTALAFTPDGYELASLSEDNTLIFWDLATQKATRGIPSDSPALGFHSFSISSDGKNLAVGIGDERFPASSPSEYNQIRLLPSSGGKKIQEFSSGGGIPRCLRFSSDGKQLVWVTAEGRVHAQRVDLAKQEWSVKGGFSCPLDLHVSPDVSRVLVVGASWDFDLFSEEEEDENEQDDSKPPKARPNGWNYLRGDSGELLRKIPFPTPIRGAWISPDGHRIALLQKDDKFVIVDPESPGEAKEIGTMPDALIATFSPDGARVAIGNRSGVIRIIELEKDSKPIELQGHHDAVTALAFSRDGKLLASGGYDTTVVLWNVANGK